MRRAVDLTGISGQPGPGLPAGSQIPLKSSSGKPGRPVRLEQPKVYYSVRKTRLSGGNKPRTATQTARAVYTHSTLVHGVSVQGRAGVGQGR